MFRIISATSTLYSTAQAEKAGFDVSSLTVTIVGRSCGAGRADKGTSMAEILHRLTDKIDTGKIFLIPGNFDYLRRGGRLSPPGFPCGQGWPSPRAAPAAWPFRSSSSKTLRVPFFDGTRFFV